MHGTPTSGLATQVSLRRYEYSMACITPLCHHLRAEKPRSNCNACRGACSADSRDTRKQTEPRMPLSDRCAQGDRGSRSTRRLDARRRREAHPSSAPRCTCRARRRRAQPFHRRSAYRRRRVPRCRPRRAWRAVDVLLKVAAADARRGRCACSPAPSCSASCSRTRISTSCERMRDRKITSFCGRADPAHLARAVDGRAVVAGRRRPATKRRCSPRTRSTSSCRCSRRRPARSGRRKCS